MEPQCTCGALTLSAAKELPVREYSLQTGQLRVVNREGSNHYFDGQPCSDQTDEPPADAYSNDDFAAWMASAPEEVKADLRAFVEHRIAAANYDEGPVNGDPRSDEQRLIDEGLLPNPNQCSESMGMTPAGIDPLANVMLQATRTLADQLRQAHTTIDGQRSTIVELDRRNIKLDRLLRYIHTNGVGALGDQADAAFEYAVGE